MRNHGVVVPALGAGIERMDERRTADRKGLTHAVHGLQAVGHVDGCDVLALGMPGGQHAGHILLPAMVQDALHRAWRAERGVCTIGCAAGKLDIGVGVAFVVIHQDEQVVIGMRERGRDGRKAHIRAATIAAEGDNVDGLLLHLALAHQRLQTHRRAQGCRAAAPELGVHPGNDPGGTVVRRVRDVHASSTAQDDRPGACGLGHHLHHQGGLAALAGAMARGEELLERNLLLSLEWLQLGKRIIYRCHRL